MKVVHICMQDFGGAGNAAYRLHKGLCEIGVDSTMLVFNKKSKDPKVKVLPDIFDGTDTYCRELESYQSSVWGQHWQRWQSISRQYPNRPTGLEVFTDIISEVRLDLLAEVKEADVINLHWVAGMINYARFADTFRDKVLIWTLHDMNAFTGGCHYNNGCYKYKQSCGSCHQLGSNLSEDLTRLQWIEKNGAYCNANFSIVTPSKWLADCAKQSALCSEVDVSVIPYGFPMDVFKPGDINALRAAHGIKTDAKLITFVAEGLDNQRKGLQYLLDAFKSCKFTSGDDYIILGVVGGLNMSMDFGTINAVKFGYVSDPLRIGEIYAMSDVFVIPSLEDNLPNTVVEALASGTPVVGFNIGGIPDMIEHKNTGYLVDDISADGLAEGITWMLKNYQADTRLKCRERAEKEFRLNLQAERYRDLYMSKIQIKLSTESNLDTLNRKAKSLAESGKTTEAIQLFEQIVAQEPLHFKANFNLGILYYQQKELKKSAKCYLKCLEINPDDRNSTINCFYVLYELGKFDEAQKIAAAYLVNHYDDEEMRNFLNFESQPSAVMKKSGVNPRKFGDFQYSKRSNFAYFKSKKYDVELFGEEVYPDNCDLKVYQDLLVFAFIKENIPKGSKILDVGGGDSRILKHFAQEYECWNIDKLEGLGNGLKFLDKINYRLVRDYIGNFNSELPDNYFDLVFSISALEHVGEDREWYQKICRDLDRVLKPGGYSLHCFDVVLGSVNQQTGAVANWTCGLLPFMHDFFVTGYDFPVLNSLLVNPDLFYMAESAYTRNWLRTTQKSYSEFGKPVSGNVGWQKKVSIPLSVHSLNTKSECSKISIITPSYNQAEFLEETILSVLSQNYPNLEYIIIDGGSTDGSLEIIKKYEKQLKYWHSRPDKGQYWAINEGFKLATGQIMGWINSDDKLHEQSLFKINRQFLEHPDYEWITGRPTAWNEDGTLKFISDQLPQWNLARILNKEYKKAFIQQESTFWRRSLWDKAGGYISTESQLIGDFELWMRFFKSAELHTVDEILGGYRYQSKQKTATQLADYMQEADALVDQMLRKNAQESNNDFVLATSLFPAGGSNQLLAYNSWLKLGFKVISFNCRAEIELLQKEYPAVTFIELSRTAQEKAGKPLIYLADILNSLQKRSYRYLGYVNSDVALLDKNQNDGCLIESLKQQLDQGRLLYANRLDVDSFDDLQGAEYAKGYDLFFFNRSVLTKLPVSDYIIGLPWWDYYLLTAAVINGVTIAKIDNPLLVHKKHEFFYKAEVWYEFADKMVAYLADNRGAHDLDIMLSNNRIEQKIYEKYLYDFSGRIVDFIRLKSLSLSLLQKSDCDHVSQKQFEQLHLSWTFYGKDDPFWAVLTDPLKKGNKWNPEEFYRHGRGNIKSILNQLADLDLKMTFGQALDFGCGAGRLTQALALYFDHVYGVDISSTMLETAEKHNQFSQKCKYLHNVEEDLRIFADNSLDFIVTIITLQHMKPKFIKKYLLEFVRILKPAGVLVFQLPGRRLDLTDEQWQIQRLGQDSRVNSSDKPVMEMNGLDKEEINALFSENHCEILSIVDDSGLKPHWESNNYIIRKLYL